jgi:hypothetical protein
MHLQSHEQTQEYPRVFLPFILQTHIPLIQKIRNEDDNITEPFVLLGINFSFQEINVNVLSMKLLN